jgi:hypothetical protein
MKYNRIVYSLNALPRRDQPGSSRTRGFDILLLKSSTPTRSDADRFLLWLFSIRKSQPRRFPARQKLPF